MQGWRPVSVLGPVEHVRRGETIGVAIVARYRGEDWGGIPMLTATSRGGQGIRRPLPSWSRLAGENLEAALGMLKRRGAQILRKEMSFFETMLAGTEQE